MTTYISILRGINVSGHRLIKMEALRKSYESIGCKNVQSYLQSGNVVFAYHAIEPIHLEKQISILINKDFGFEVPTIVMSVDKLKKIIVNNPFTRDASKDIALLHVTFLSSKPDCVDLKNIEDKKQEGEEIFISDDVVYLFCPKGYGNTKLSNNFLEAKLKVGATTRNWKTTNELLKLAETIYTTD